MSYLYFTSYARDNRQHPTDEADLLKFVDDLENDVRQLEHPHADKIMFFDTKNIESGNEWPLDLADALRTSRLCVCLFSASYFNSKWCGREFQVFLERRKSWMAQAANAGKRPQVLLPVRWIDVRNVPPQIAEFLQEWDDTLPPAYRELGVRQLMRLSEHKDDYVKVVNTLAKKIVGAATATPLPDLPNLRPLDEVPNVFKEPTKVGKTSSTRKGVENACFVFLAGRQDEVAKVRQSVEGYSTTDGWNWRPFHPAQEGAGAMAQQIAGQMGLRFQELACDGALAENLRAAKRDRIPTVLLADAWTSRLPEYQALLAEYDDLNLTNCALLVPWNDEDAETAGDKAELRKALRSACPQKMLTPPPNHYWDSINSFEELRNRTTSALEEVRMRLMQIILTEAGEGEVRKAESNDLAAAASQQGISLQMQPHLQNGVGGAGGV